MVRFSSTRIFLSKSFEEEVDRIDLNYLFGKKLWKNVFRILNVNRGSMGTICRDTMKREEEESEIVY